MYELVAGALASYLLGNSILWFSLIIGTYLSAMGVGGYLSKFVEKQLVARFIEVELVVALLGGFQAPVLFATFAFGRGLEGVLFALVFATGMFVGLELPLLIRILDRSGGGLRELVARVMFLDYVGALAASVGFPLIFLPQLGLLRTSLVFGLVNAVVAITTTFLLEAPAPVVLRLRIVGGGVIALLLGGLIGAQRFEGQVESALFSDAVIYAEQTPYQRIIVTHRDRDTRLYLDGALQFSSIDEYRYHEALVHPVMATAARAKRVLVLGGGDGLAVREILKHPVDEVVLVELDPRMAALFEAHADLAALNGGSLSDPRVKVITADAFSWLRARGPDDPRFDVVIIDFPDPNHVGLGKLYTNYFYHLLRGAVADDGAIAVQATSPMFSPDAYWCVVATLADAGWAVRPYHVYVPSFGEWGFVLAAKTEPNPGPILAGQRFLDDAAMAQAFVFPRDLARRDEPVNRLDNQVLVSLYDDDWRAAP